MVGDGNVDTRNPESCQRTTNGRSLVQDAVLAGGKEQAGGSSKAGLSFERKMITEVTSQMAQFPQEAFGTLAGLIRFDTEAEAFAMASDTSAGVASYVSTLDLRRSGRLSEALEYGMFSLKTGLISTTIAPVGGIKES